MININKKLVLIILLVVLGISLLIIATIIGNRFSNTVTTTNYTFKYDNTWSLKSKKSNQVNLVHKSGSKITINIKNIDNDNKYQSIDQLIDEIVYMISEKNKNYKLISKKKTTLTKYEYDGYKLLYENDKENVMVVVFKKGDKLFILTYSALTDYFDILLDSVNNIVYNFDILEKKYNLSKSLKISTNKIEYSRNKELDKVIKKNTEYEIASSNYYVKYSIPNIFDVTDISSVMGNYNYKNINLVVNVLNRNIYEYVDKSSSLNIYDEYSGYKDNKNYSGYKEYLDQKGDFYIYKNNYKYTKENIKTENVILIYPLNKNHIATFKLTANDSNITKKLVDRIKIIEYKNYSSNIKIEKKNNKLLGELKQYTSYSNNEIVKVKLKLPSSYKEIDNNDNMYKTRSYVNSYDKDLDLYNYQVNYSILNNNIESEVASINGTFVNAYGVCNYLVRNSDIEINKKAFISYSGDYDNLAGILFTNINRTKYHVNKRVLFYKISDNNYLKIEISANNKNITNEVLKDVLDFTVDKK